MTTRKKATAKPAEPTDEAPAEPEQTTDYTRRAGGFVLTDRGWVLEGEG